MRQFQICLFIATLALACSKNVRPKPVHFMDFEVDSLQVFEFGQADFVQTESLVFSPFEKNKVWFMTRPDLSGGGIELDLKTGQKLSFSTRFGSDLLKNWDGRLCQIDPFEPQICWFSTRIEGFLRFDNRTKSVLQIHDFPKNALSLSILFSEKEVWLGTSKGLWRFDRSTSQCLPVENSPREFIQTLSKWGLGRVLANGRYIFDPATNCWELLHRQHHISPESIEYSFEKDGFLLLDRRDVPQLTIIRSDGKMTETTHYFSFEPPKGGQQTSPFGNFLRGEIFGNAPVFWSRQTEHLVRLDLDSSTFQIFPFEFVHDPMGQNFYAETPEDIWVCSSESLSSFEKSTGKRLFFQSPHPMDRFRVRADSRHLYFLNEQKLVIVSQKFLRKRCEIGNPNLQYAEFRQMLDSLKIYNSIDWRDRRAKIEILKKHFQKPGNSYFRAEIGQLFSQLSSACPDETCLLEMLTDSTLENSAVDAGFENLIARRARLGDLRGAVAAGGMFRKHRPESKFYEKYEHADGSESDNLLSLEAALKSLDSLDAAGLPADVLLFQKGKRLEQMVVGSGEYFVGNSSCYDFSLPDSVFRKLERTMPNSELADDAAFILNRFCFEGEDGSCLPEAVQSWQKFIKKYPNSDRRAEALANAAWALCHDNLQDLKKGLRWLAEAEQLRPDLFLKNSEPNLNSIKETFQNNLDRREIRFSMRLKKSKIKTGEPVELIFSLKNTGEEKKTLRQIVSEGRSNFHVEVSFENPNLDCIAPVRFSEIENFVSPPEFVERKIAPGEVFEETCDLTKAVQKRRFAGLVRFPFDQPGVYRIRGFWSFADEYESSVILEVE